MVRPMVLRAASALFASALWLALCAPAAAEDVGVAVYYADELTGRPTASGQPYDPQALTAAHHSLPFGARVRVTNVSNGAAVIVRINDRIPAKTKILIDLSRRAAETLQLIRQGRTKVRVEVLGPGEGPPKRDVR